MKIKKTIAAVAAAAMVFTSVPMVAFAAEHTHTSACYEMDDVGHKLIATKCAAAVAAITGDGEKPDAAAADGTYTEHAWTFVGTNSSSKVAGEKKCSVCGYTTTCEHKATTAGTSDDVGKKVCNLCGEKTACTSHKWIGGSGDTGKKCELCNTTADCEHTTTKFVQANSGAKHQKVCADCGKEIGSAGNHDADATGFKNDGTNHWKICKDCGLEMDKDACSFSVDSTADNSGKDGHTKKCGTCGATKVEAHTLTVNTSTGKTDETHTKNCACGYSETEAHKFDTWSTNKTVCACGQEEPADAKHEHDTEGWKVDSNNSNAHTEACSVCGKFPDSASSHPAAPGEWETDAAQHWKTCTKCDILTEAKAPHDFPSEEDLRTNATLVKDKCTTCGYVKTTTPEQKPEDKPEQKPEDKPEQKPEETTPTTPAESSGSSSSSSSGGAVSGNAGTVPTVSSASDMRTSNNTNVNIKASETKVTPAIVNAFVKNKKTKTMTITYSTKLRVAVSKSDIKGTPALDFSVSGNKFLSSKLMNNSALAKAKTVVQIDFVNKGKIDGVDKVTVQSRVGGKYAGEKATVYEYVDGKLVKVATAKVGGSGLVSFKVDHLGQYVVVVG